MTVVPLPASPCVRVTTDYTNEDGSLASSRFFLSYSGAAPSAANCVTLAGDIGSAWESDIAPLVSSEWSLTLVDVEDISTEIGNHGSAAESHAGTRSGTAMPAQVAMNVEYDIARRYRGGKPRQYFPAGVTSDTADGGHWSAGFVTTVNSAVAAYYAAIEALSVGSMGTLAHVNISFYQGFTNITNSSGRTRAAPKYRATGLVDTVTGYAGKPLMGSQRRRRNATSY